MRFDLLRFELIWLGCVFDKSSSFGCGFADKDRELGEAQAEIKALRFSERLREKAVEEVISIFQNFGSLSPSSFSSTD